MDWTGLLEAAAGDRNSGQSLKSNPAETGLPAETGRNSPKRPKQAGIGRDFG